MKNKLKVLVTDNLSSSGLEILRKSGFEVKMDSSLDGKNLEKEIRGYDGLIIRSGTNVTKEIIDNADKLKIIGRAGVGVDNVDLESATRKGIVVMNVPAGNTISACEHTWALIMSLLRNVPFAHQALSEKKWQKKKYKGKELYGKKLGVVGLGKIGYEVAKRANAFGMHVLVHDPYTSADKAKEVKADMVELEELLKESDVITLHMPVNEKTKNFINEDTIKKMKKSSFLINCARGGIVNEEDLAEAVKEGRISGAAVDVYKEEPTSDSPLLGLNNVIHTPHLGAATSEAQERVAVEIAEQVSVFLKTGKIVNAVNAVGADIEVELKKLAEKLGVFAGQYTEKLTKKAVISYKDKIRKSGESVSRFILMGYLSQFNEGVNLVNAQMLATEKGMRVAKQVVSDNDMYGEIKIEFNGDFSIEGGIIGKKARLTGLNGYIFDIPLSGNLLAICNIDRPGIVGHIGTILADYEINIASMEVGREKIGGKAVTIIEVDGDIPEEVVEKLKKVEYIEDVKNIKVSQ